MSQTRLAVIMDPIESIKPRKDSTLAMLVEAQARGWSVHYGQLNDIWLRDGHAFGDLTELQVADDPAKWYELGDRATIALADVEEGDANAGTCQRGGLQDINVAGAWVLRLAFAAALRSPLLQRLRIVVDYESAILMRWIRIVDLVLLARIR